MKGNKREKLAKVLVRVVAIECVVLIAVVLVILGVKNKERLFGKNDEKETNVSNSTEIKEDGDILEASGTKVDASITEPTEEDKKLSEEELLKKAEEEQKAAKRKLLQEEANLLALGYDYDAAIEKLKACEDYATDEELQKLTAEYEEAKSKLVPFGAFQTADEISHVFFHSLIVDTSKAFDGDHMSNGYNYWMTTTSEFKLMLEQMYERGYVLVSIHDIAKEGQLEDGSIGMVKGDLLLPPDKKPFVLSQDDTNFYDYMRTDGFATRIVIDEDGYPACEIELDGKTVVDRDYDVVPILEKFIEEHPDFSYRGARGIIGVTGYEGVIGYRTNDPTSPTYEQDVKQAKEVAERLKEIGWEFASHSYGHGHMGQKSANYVKEDSERWAKECASIIGETDIYLYPYGEDIQEGIGDYKGEKYDILYNSGFRYYCGVYAHPWIQIKGKYVRMTRRNLDGYTMHFYPERLEDLFDVAKTIDPARPEFK